MMPSGGPLFRLRPSPPRSESSSPTAWPTRASFAIADESGLTQPLSARFACWHGSSTPDRNTRSRQA